MVTKEKLVDIFKAAVSKDKLRAVFNYVMFNGSSAVACDGMVLVELPFKTTTRFAVNPKTKEMYPIDRRTFTVAGEQYNLPNFGDIRPNIDLLREYATISTVSRFNPDGRVKIGENNFSGENLNTVLSIAEKLGIKKVVLAPYDQSIKALYIKAEEGFDAIVTYNDIYKPYIEILEEN